MRRPTWLFICVTVGVGLGLFQLKYEVMSLEKDYSRLRKNIAEVKDSMHVLKAEWSHLNDPKRLQVLAEKHLNIGPITSAQLVSFQKITGNTPKEDKDSLDDLMLQLSHDPELTALKE